MTASGIAVVGIGLLMYRVLKDVNQRLAIWYPILRIVELTVSAACGVYLLNQLQVVPNHLLWVYVPTGLGGLILTYLLFVSRLVPRPIAVLGLVGYALLTLGVPLDLLGVLNMNEGMGQADPGSGRAVRVRLHAVLVDRQGIRAIVRDQGWLVSHVDRPKGVVLVRASWRWRAERARMHRR